MRHVRTEVIPQCHFWAALSRLGGISVVGPTSVLEDEALARLVLNARKRISQLATVITTQSNAACHTSTIDVGMTSSFIMDDHLFIGLDQRLA